MIPRVVSIQTGRSRCFSAESDVSKQWSSAIIKDPVDGAVTVGTTGLHGDEQSDLVHHGGSDKALLAYSFSHYAFWKARYPELDFQPGGFGENLTVSGIDESTCCVGDIFEVGNCLFDVSQPRQPCWKLSRRWGIPNLAQQVQHERRTGWYLRVLRTGDLASGETMILRERPNPDFPIVRALDIMYAKPRNSADDLLLSKLPQLSESWKRSLTLRATQNSGINDAERLTGQ
ncbi:MAG: MOSC domain-containing protein [Planctomycetaceae bacterium]|nr:MOSC domain-containing protein [Planctomycetaceae bacterium]